MKRLNVITLSCLVALMTSCAPSTQGDNGADMNSDFEQLIKEKTNPKISELFSFVESQYENGNNVLQELEGSNEECSMNKNIWVGNHPDFIEEAKNCDLIREKTMEVFGELAESACEVYRYDRHTDDSDTIQYALNLSDKPGERQKWRGLTNICADETASYVYVRHPGNKVTNANLSYYVRLLENKDYKEIVSTSHGDTIIYHDLELPFRIKDYENTAMAVLDSMGVRHVAIEWEQKEEAIPDDKLLEKFLAYSYTTYDKKKGYTTTGKYAGYRYSIPAKDDKLAANALRKLYAATLKFLRDDPFQDSYKCQLGRDYDEHPCTILRVSCTNPDIDKIDKYEVYIYKDEKSYNILLLQYTGDLWFPRDLKSPL